MERKLPLGDVLVFHGTVKSPWAQPSIMGEARAEALRKFRDGEPLGDLTFWYGAFSRGSRQLTDPTEVEFSGLRSRRPCRAKPYDERDLWYCEEHGWWNGNSTCGGRIT